ncbi:hypothetical protein FT663_03248 [Candidozyma haemuli var. vulneris]|nr:hypothetical protein FT662_03863 [[Candida] haemuloni var. vulneris]KAF3990305.1 hypothetical protein FT663_03248 [[Candida] haemuloni var. vulneris]
MHRNYSKEWGPRLDAEGNPLPKSERKPKRKVACMLGYCGTGYNGMQTQPDPKLKTIEDVLFKAFAEAGAVSEENSDDLKKNSFMRAARTDKGVHAAGNVVSLKLIIEDPDIIAKINAALPDQIRVWGIERCNRSFDCRKMCSSRIYEYLLPTHSLLPPRPHSSLLDLIEKSRKEHPGILRDDPDQAWWETTRQRMLDAGITEEQLRSVFEKTDSSSEDNIKLDYLNEDGEVTEYGELVKRVRAIENTCRSEFRVSEEKLNLFREAMNQYVGSHNFHNFTLGKNYNDPSSRRFMKGTSVSKPFIIEGSEWISIKIHGQSFMLHQIRKMICMASLVVRTGCPVTRISDCFGPAKINIPKAPALGLLLECPVYEAYNGKLEELGYNAIDFSRYQEEMDAFKMKHIYDKIYAEEDKQKVFQGFFEFLDKFKNSEARSGGKHIFDFLGAAFNNGVDNKESSKESNVAKATENVD